jgi:hypothetical protein
MSRLSDRYWKIKCTQIDDSFRFWEDIDFEAKVHKSIQKEPNKSDITIFNLNAESRAFFSEDGATIEVIAGYKSQDLNGRLLKAQIDIITNKRDGVEWETKIVARDGAKTTRNAKIEKTFAAGTDNKAIMNALIQILTSPPVVKVSKRTKTAPAKKNNVVPLIKGNIDLSTVSGKLAKARTLKGLAIDYYAEFCRSFNLRFQVNDGTLHTVKSNFSIMDEVIILDSESGLIGVPENTETGWKFKSLLRFDLEPGQKVRVKSSVLSSDILMTDVTHDAKTQGEWLTEIEGIII